MEQKPTPTPQPAQEHRPVHRPDEQGSLNIDDFVRIYDPNTDQIVVEKRS